jgi:hypothetical protein
MLLILQPGVGAMRRYRRWAGENVPSLADEPATIPLPMFPPRPLLEAVYDLARVVDALGRYLEASERQEDTRRFAVTRPLGSLRPCSKSVTIWRPASSST